MAPAKPAAAMARPIRLRAGCAPVGLGVADRLVGDQRVHSDRRHERERDERRHARWRRGSARRRRRRRRPARGCSVCTLRSRNADVGEQVQRDAAAQRDRRHGVRAASPTCASVFFTPEREQHDAGDHRQVQVACRSRAPSARARRPRRVRSRRSATSATTSKYATTARPRPRRRAARRRSAGVQRRPAAPTPIETIDSPSAMMTISPWRSAKCAGEHAPAADADQRTGRHVVDGSATHPDARLRAGRRRAGATISRPRRCRKPVRHAARSRARTSASSRPASMKRTMCSTRTARVGDARTAARRRRTRRGTASDAMSVAAIATIMASRVGALLGVDRVGQPGVRRPRPPQRGQHEQAVAEARPTSGRRPSAPCTWVIANTNTRSKNSSSEVTFCSVSTRRRGGEARPSASMIASSHLVAHLEQP